MNVRLINSRGQPPRAGSRRAGPLVSLLLTACLLSAMAGVAYILVFHFFRIGS